MRALRIVCSMLMVWGLFPIAVHASGSEPTASVDESISEARRFIYEDFDYASAIDVLTPVLEAAQSDPEMLRESYLLLIEAYVLRGNRSASDLDRTLNHEKAIEWIRACLSRAELRHVYPDDEAAVNTFEYFEQVRREMFGTFEITALDPVDAEVIFDGDLLIPDEAGVLRQEDVPKGTRLLVIRHSDYEDWTEDIDIEASRVVSRTYELDRNKGVVWYLTRIGAPVVALAGLLAVVVTSDGNQDDPADPLPAPPDPPARR